MGNPCGFTGGDMATGRASNGGVPGVFKPYECAYGPVGSEAFFPGTRESTGRELSFRGAARSSARRRVGTQHQMSVSHQKYSTRRVRGDASCDSFPRTKGQRVSTFFFSKTSHPTRLDALCATEYDCENAIRFVAQLEQSG